jgi:hypothetical protein
MKKKWYCLLAVVTLYACNSSKKDKPAQGEDPTEDQYINYTALISDQIRLLDSTPLAIFKYTTNTSGKTDTVIIQREEFHQLAKEFLEPDIMQPALKKDYTVSNFGDVTTKLANFTYETKNPSHTVQRLNLRFKTGAGSKLTSLDMLKNISGPAPVTRKLFWKSNRYFHIINDMGNGKYTRVEVAWNLATPEAEVN